MGAKKRRNKEELRLSIYRVRYRTTGILAELSGENMAGLMRPHTRSVMTRLLQGQTFIHEEAAAVRNS